MDFKLFAVLDRSEGSFKYLSVLLSLLFATGLVCAVFVLKNALPSYDGLSFIQQHELTLVIQWQSVNLATAIQTEWLIVIIAMSQAALSATFVFCILIVCMRALLGARTTGKLFLIIQLAYGAVAALLAGLIFYLTFKARIYISQLCTASGSGVFETERNLATVLAQNWPDGPTTIGVICDSYHERQGWSVGIGCCGAIIAMILLMPLYLWLIAAIIYVLWDGPAWIIRHIIHFPKSKRRSLADIETAAQETPRLSIELSDDSREHDAETIMSTTVVDESTLAMSRTSSGTAVTNQSFTQTTSKPDKKGES